MATVTITDADRVIWAGSYADFQCANLDALSISEFCALHTQGSILVGGGASPLLRIVYDQPSGATIVVTGMKPKRLNTSTTFQVRNRA